MMRPVGGTGCAGPSRIGIPTAAASVPVAVTVRPRSGLNRRYATPAVSGSNTSSYCRPPTPPRPARDGAWLPAGRDRRNRPPQAVQQYQVRHYLKDVDKPGPGRGRTESTLTSGAKRFQHRVAAFARLGRGYHIHDPLLLRLFDASGDEHIDVLVIPPEADADCAERALRLAGGVGSIERPDRILELAASSQGKRALGDPE
jgi:hypothetical protein